MYNDSLKLPSAITFYNSKVEITNCEFLNNTFGDDYVNFYNSYFKVNNSLFQNIYSDAIDSDFSIGEISGNVFINIGNDALDLSGSNVQSFNNSFLKIGDKSISAGENSNIDSINDKFIECEIGIVSKDGSKVSSVSNLFKKNKLDYVVFMKKDFYKTPILEIDHKLDEIKYLFEENSKIITKYNSVIVFDKNVGDLLYGKKYGKATN